MKRSNEPIFWGLFGAGGMATAFITPVLILITGILVPLGIISPEHLSYERVIAFSESIWGALILLAAICLPLWLTMHRIHHGLHDLGIHGGRTLSSWVFYGVAFVSTIVCITLLIQIGF